MKNLSIFALVALLPACATIVEGTSDTVTLSTNPAGAACTIDRNGQRVGAVPTTPGSVRIGKSRHDLNVACSKEGYRAATATASSRFTGTTIGNVVAGGFIGVAVDAASGANSRYPSEVRLDLVKDPRRVAMEPADSAPIRPAGHRRTRGPAV